MDSGTDERMLLSSLKNGDAKAFGVIFKKYAPRFYSYSFKILKNRHEAEEVVQDTFTKVWENRVNINEDLNFHYYLITIAKNKTYTLFRRRVAELKLSKNLALDPEHSWPEETEVQLADLEDVLRNGINMLSPQQKEIILMKAQGLSNSDIAEKLSITKKTVENHLNRAYRNLREQLGEWKDLLPLLLAVFMNII